MKTLSNEYFISSPLKRLFFLLGMTIFLAGCGAAGGFSLDAPVADLEGGTRFAATVCDTIPDAPQGAFVRVTNNQDLGIAPVEKVLGEDKSFSLIVCVDVGESVDLQIFDENGNALSDIQTIVRETDDRTERCPQPSNTNPPECPPQQL